MNPSFSWLYQANSLI